MPTTFVFVHGAFGSPAELAPAAPYLESEGHRVLNVDLPSEKPDATSDDYASAVCRAMVNTSGPRILVEQMLRIASWPAQITLQRERQWKAALSAGRGEVTAHKRFELKRGVPVLKQVRSMARLNFQAIVHSSAGTFITGIAERRSGLKAISVLGGHSNLIPMQALQRIDECCQAAYSQETSRNQRVTHHARHGCIHVCTTPAG